MLTNTISSQTSQLELHLFPLSIISESQHEKRAHTHARMHALAGIAFQHTASCRPILVLAWHSESSHVLQVSLGLLKVSEQAKFIRHKYRKIHSRDNNHLSLYYVSIKGIVSQNI